MRLFYFDVDEFLHEAAKIRASGDAPECVMELPVQRVELFVDSLVFALWKFARRDHGVITRSGPAGDIRLTVDFAQVITSAHLDTRIKLMKHSQ